MRLLVSCIDGGSLKEVVCNQKTDTSVKTALQPLHVESHLGHGLNHALEKIHVVSKDFIIVVRANGVAELVRTTSSPKEYPEDKPEESKSEEDKKATEEIAVEFPEFDITSFEIVDMVTGLLDDTRLEPLYKDSKKRTKLVDGFVTLVPLPNKLNTYFLASKSGLVHIITHNRKSNKLIKETTLEVKAPLEFAQLYDLGKKFKNYVFGYGGEENLVKLVELSFDFSKLTQIWEAKNVKNDRLDMRVPIWPIGLKFLGPLKSDKIDKNKLNYQFLVMTRYSHLGKYKTQHGMRPVEYKQLSSDCEPLSNLELIGEDITELGNAKVDNFSDISFITTDTRKDVLKYSHDGRLLFKYGKSDIVGAPTFVSIYNNQYLLEGGLDRYLRVYDIAKNIRIAKVYVGSKINFIAMVDGEDVEMPLTEAERKKAVKLAKRKFDPEEEEEDAEQLWDQLENKMSKKQMRSKN